MPTPPDHLVVFGRPGSGKSSLAERLGADFGYRLVRTGELLRAAVREGGFLGQRVAAHLAMGDLVPDPLIFELLEQSLTAPGSDRLLFDGFPRTIGQVALLEKFEAKLDFAIEGYLEVAVSLEVAVARMTGRRVCPVCGATYHVLSRPPRVAEHCDVDGATLERRKDDKADVVEFRQKVYEVHAIPILSHYQAVAPTLYHVVDGALPFEAVYAEALAALGLGPGGSR